MQIRSTTMSAMAIVLVAGAAAPSAAQSQALGPDAPGVSGTERVADAPQAVADAGDIIVTAQKQRQTLQRTPAAVTALGGASLIAAGVTELTAVQAFVPSVRFQNEGASTEVYIRGVGSSLDLPQIDPPTAVNFNGVYIPREATSVGLYDVDQIEVLPGPQGTLYGRSTIGGAVNVNFVRPGHELGGSALLEIGNYAGIHATAVANLPVSSVLAVRIAGDYTRHDGYERSGADSANDTGFRLSLLYTPTDRLTVYAWGAIANLGGSPPNLVPAGVDPTGASVPDRFLNRDPWNDQFPANLAAQLPFGQPRAQQYQDYRNRMIGGQIDWTLGDGMTLTYIPSYLTLHSGVPYWLGAIPANKTDNYEQITQELRLAGGHRWLTWLGGLYAYRLTSHGSFFVNGFDPATAFPVYLVDSNRIQGVAAFGQATATVSDGLRLTIGGRYSHDERVASGRFFAGPAGLLPYAYNRNFDHFDYKAGVEYDLAPRVLLYGSIQTGYQPGTFNAYASSPALSNEVRPAKLTAYTVGAKARLFDNRLTLNDEFFYYDYTNLFASAYDAVINSTRTFNAQSVEIYGNQLDAVLRITEADRLNASVGYLHARIKQLVLPGGQNYNGNQLQYSPEWTVNAGFSHDFQLPGAAVLKLTATTHFESSYFIDFQHTPGGHQAPFTKTDLSLAYQPENGRFGVAAFVKNIENRAVIGAAGNGTAVPANAAGATAFLEAPRTFGFRFTAKY